MEDRKIKITSDIDFDDLSLYGINVEVDTVTGEVLITRKGTVLVSVKHDAKTGKYEIKQRCNGCMKTVLNDLLLKIQNYQEKLKEANYKIEELDHFFYEFICNGGYKAEENILYQYDAETRKLFWEFFNQYVKMRFQGNYQNGINVPELIEIEQTIIELDIEEEKDLEAQKVFQEAQFFCYTRQKIRNKKGK